MSSEKRFMAIHCVLGLATALCWGTGACKDGTEPSTSSTPATSDALPPLGPNTPAADEEQEPADESPSDAASNDPSSDDDDQDEQEEEETDPADDDTRGGSDVDCREVCDEQNEMNQEWGARYNAGGRDFESFVERYTDVADRCARCQAESGAAPGGTWSDGGPWGGAPAGGWYNIPDGGTWYTPPAGGWYYSPPRSTR